MTKPTVLVSSNCQTETITEALQVLLPEYTIIQEHIPEDATDTSYLAPYTKQKTDYLVTSNQLCLTDEFQNLFPKTKIIPIPTIAFAAFHPDIVYAVDPNKKRLRCLDADYHSALVLWGWKNSLSAAQIKNLFCTEVFRRVGFLNAWEPCVQQLRDRFAACEFDFTHFWREVQREGIFMHSMNHPKVSVIAHLTKQIAGKILAQPINPSQPFAELLTDQLSAIRWPVYPEIAKQYGQKGMYMWKIRKAKYLTLDEYIEGALDSYDRTNLDKEQITFHSLGYKELNENLQKMVKY